MRLTTLLIVALCTLPVAVTHAAPTLPFGISPNPQQRQNGAGNKDSVARQAQRLNGGGRVLSVEAVEGGYRVKLLKDGDVRIVFVPDSSER
jgi:hypothetical protein